MTLDGTWWHSWLPHVRHPPPPLSPLSPSLVLGGQILALEMHRGLRPLGAAVLPPPLQAATLPGSGSGGGSGGAEEGVGVEGSRAAAKAVEGFIRKNIEAYFGCWTSTYTLFSLDPRLVSWGWSIALGCFVALGSFALYCIFLSALFLFIFAI